MTIRSTHPEDEFAASLAHQIKTPLSILQHAATNLRRNLRGLVKGLETLTSPDVAGMKACHLVSDALGVLPAPPPTGLLAHDRVKATAMLLRNGGVDGDLEAAASSLIRGGWDTCIEEIMPFLHEAPQGTISTLEAVGRLRSNLSGIESSVERIQTISAALRLLGQSSIQGSVDLRHCLETSVARVRPLAPGGVFLDMLDVGAGSIPPVVGDKDLLGQVWTNLITNSLQSIGEKGSITIEMQVRRSALKTTVLVKFTDDGPGISAEVQARMFEPYFTTRATQGGEGLGLALAKCIVTKCGGTITVTSRPGQTCFMVVLQAAVSTAVAGAQAS